MGIKGASAQIKKKEQKTGYARNCTSGLLVATIFNPSLLSKREWSRTEQSISQISERCPGDKVVV